MRITFTPTEKDFMDAQRTHAWRRYNPAMARLQRTLEPFVGVFLILFAVHLARTNANRGIVLLEFVLGLYVLLASRVLGPFLYRRAYRERHNSGPDVTALDFEHDAILMNCPEDSSGRLEWPAILGTIESETTLLLYLAPARFLFIPKRFVEEFQLTALANLLREKNVPAGYPKS